MFIVQFNDGRTITEKEKTWEDIVKENDMKTVSAISLKDETTGLTHTLKVKDTLGCFQHKIGFIDLIPGTLGTRNEPKVETEIGAVINKEGDCLILNLNTKTSQVFAYMNNINKMRLNKKLHGIQLE
jgi:hypothetical protein